MTPDQSPVAASPEPLLEVRDLRIRFGGILALDGLSLSAGRGEIVGVIGPNGAGKTTLFNCISGVLRQYAGSIFLEGRAIDRMPPHRRARLGVTRTFQNLALFRSLSVADNIRTAAEHGGRAGRNGTSRDVAHQLMAEFGIAAIADRRVTHLPTGTRRKVELARALAGRPKLLLLDEPTAGLNADDAAEIVATIRRLRAEQGLTVLLVEHQMPVVTALCDRVAVLVFGRKIADGPPDTIRRDPAVLAAYLEGPRP